MDGNAAQPAKRENMRNSLKNIVALVAMLLLSLALTAPAAFGQSSRDAYVEPGPATLDRVPGGTNGSSVPGAQAQQAQASEGELPFTGLDVALIAAAGVSLLLMGFAMRRLTRAPDAA